MIDLFIEPLQKSFQSYLEKDTPLQKMIREKAWNRFMELGLPQKTLPGYQYFPLSQLYQESFEQQALPQIPKEKLLELVYPECRHSYLVFLNGQYMPELSDMSFVDAQTVILPLQDALQQYGSFLQGRLSRLFKEQEDSFASLNIALTQRGLFFYVPPGVVLQHPVQCIHLTSTDRAAVFSPRIHLFIGKKGELKWIDHHHCLKEFEYFSNSLIDISLEEGAVFEQYGILNPYSRGWHMECMHATLKKESRLKSLCWNLGTKSTRQNYHIAITGERASCDLKGIAMLAESRQAHVNVLMDHQAPHCTSNQLFKNVLSDASRASFEGKIFIHPEGQKTEAYQLNNNLLLDSKAIANNKPNLEIFADDVKASHGATVSQLNPLHLFYVKARGMQEADAKMLLLSAFCLEILKDVPYATVKDKMQDFMQRYLRR